MLISTFRWIFPLCILAVAMAPPASAGYVYQVDLSVPCQAASMSAVGTITVDKLGVLAVSDIVDYSLTFTSPNDPPTTLTPSNGVVVFFGNVSLTASASALTVTLPGEFEIVEPNYLGYDISLAFTTTAGNPQNLLTIANQSVYGDVGSINLGNGAGTYLVGPAAVPEPSSLVLACTASVLTLGYLGSRRHRRARTP